MVVNYKSGASWEIPAYINTILAENSFAADECGDQDGLFVGKSDSSKAKLP